MELRSSAFEDGGAYPVRCAKDGDQVSPPLEWSDLPQGTQELALVLEVVTSSTDEPHVQWLVYGISPDLRRLDEGFTYKLHPQWPADVLQGLNSNDNTGYDGPLAAADRPLHLRFRLLALDERLDLPAGLTKDELLSRIEGHIRDEADLTAIYERQYAD